MGVALQGGGSHGAFTWGVLDRLLQQSVIVIDSVTGTNAGAINAVVLADGLVHLFNLGSNAADRWLAENGEAVGGRSTIDLAQLLPVDA
jgi:NTE family protein